MRSEAVTLNLKASNSTLFFLLCFREKTPAPRWFYCHCVTFSATLLSGGGGRGWLFVLRTAAALCCRWGKWTFLRQFQPTPEQRPGFISAGACWSSLLTAEILRCSLPECKKEKHSGEIKNGGMAATTKLNHSLLGLSLPNAIFYHVEMSGEPNRETEQREQHLHVWL